MITPEQFITKNTVFPTDNLLMVSAKVLANLPLAVMAEDPNGNVKIVNKAFCILFNIVEEPEKLSGAKSKKLIASIKKHVKNELAFSKQHTQSLLNPIAIPNLEFELKNKNYLHVEYAPCFDRDLLLGHIWCYKDITPMVKVTNQLDEQKIFFETILNSIPADIAILDKHHKYIFINKTAIKNPELRTWLIGKDDFDYYRSKNADENAARIREEKFITVLQQKKEVEWEDEFTNKTGVKKQILRRLHPNFDENGNISFVTGYGVNISELKKKEHKLMRSEYKHRKLLTQLNEVVFRLTLSREIEFLNPAWTKILGYHTDECLGKFLPEFAIPSDRKIISEAIENIISGNISTINTVIGFTAKDGKVKWLNVYMAKAEIIVELSLWGTLTDITERQIAEQELLKTLQKEKELNELKSSFVNMVSHEFRTPMAGILSSVELLEIIDEQLENSVKSESAYYYELIKNQVSRMTGLMNNVLMLGKIEAGKIQFTPSEVILSNLCREIIQQNFAHPSLVCRIAITVTGKEKALQLDSNLIKHILINLLSNALKYSPKDTNPELKLSFCKKNTTIQVIDNGIGIPKGEMKKLFSSFFRASNTGNVEGTGLGLVVVKYFVELHGGTIKVQSRHGEGTIFTVVIPNHASQGN